MITLESIARCIIAALAQLGRAHHVAGTPAAIYITPTRKDVR